MVMGSLPPGQELEHPELGKLPVAPTGTPEPPKGN
jgi:hypothetical protein